MMEIIINELELNLIEIKENFDKQIARFRTGRANANMLDSIFVSMYGESTQLKFCAKISIPEPQQLIVKPYDRNILSEIASTISKSNLNLNPQVEGDQIRIKIPTLTQDLREKIVKDLKAELENFKVQVRNARRHANDTIKKAEGVSEDLKTTIEEQVEKLSKAAIEELEFVASKKEKEILTI